MKKCKFINKKLLCITAICIITLTLSSCQFNNTNADASSSNSSKTTALNGTIMSSGSTNRSSYTGGLPVSNQNFSTPGTPVKASTIAIGGNVFYYCNSDDNNKIYTMKTSDAADANAKGNSKVVQSIKKISEDVASEIVVTNNFIFYTNGSDSNKIYSMNLDGTGPKKITDAGAHDIVMVGNYIYYIADDGTLSVVDTGNGNEFSFGIKTKCFTSDGSSIYYELDDPNGAAIYSMKIDGENAVKINDDEPISIAADSGNIYYADGKENDSLYTESSGKRVKLGEIDTSSLTVDSGWIYYINKSDYSKIYKIKVDGTSNTKVSDMSFVKSFIISGNIVYFGRSINAQSIIYKVNK